MVRLSLTLATLVSAIGVTQAAIPSALPANVAVQSTPDHSYFVFFEAGKAGLTPEAREIVHSAAQRAHATGRSKVRVMLPPGANSATMLSRNRARAVKAELERDGVKPGSIGNAGQSEDVAYAHADPMVRAWLGRCTIVEVAPVPNADSDGRVG